MRPIHARTSAVFATACLMLVACVVAQDEPDKPPAYGDHRNLMVYVDNVGNEKQIKTREDWLIRQAHILLGIQQATGPLPPLDDQPALDVKVTQRVRGDGYDRLTVSFAVERSDDVKTARVTAYLYVPHGIANGERRPAMLALHPTHRIGKGVVDGQSERPNRGYAKELAQRGYVVIAPDYPSFGDLTGYDFANDRYVSGTMKGIVNHMCCVDLLVSRYDVDAKRIGVIGHSLGGHNAMFVAVFDTRLKVVVTSCGWTPFHDYYGGKIAGWTSDRYMPRLRDEYQLDPDRVPFDFYEVVAAIAPRAFFSNSPLNDGNFDARGVRKAERESKKVYQLLDAADRMLVRYPDAGHDFPLAVRRESYRFIDKILKHTPTRDLP